LGWKGGDKICAYHHPDHVFAIRLIKSTNGGGWKVRKIPNSTILEFTFPWKLVTPLRFRAVAAVDYTTPRDEYLAFIMDFPKEPKEKMLERAKEEQRASLM
jgi:hypothetical protein